jgi:hypothetical protein
MAGQIQINGAMCRVRRADQSTGTDGGTVRAWQEVGTQPQHVRLIQLSAGQAQRMWGLESTARFIGAADMEADIQQLDGILVQDGAFAGTRLRVESVTKTLGLGRTRYQQLELTETTETFGAT